MPSCVMKKCTNYDKKFLKKNDGISYHRFPTDPNRNEDWCRIIRLQRNEPNFKSNKHIRVCSSHFAAEDYYYTETGLRKLKKEAVPRVAHLNEDQNTKERLEMKESPFPVAFIDVRNLQTSVITPIHDSLEEKCIRQERRHIISKKKIKNLEKQIIKLKRKNQSLVKIIKDFKQNGAQ